MKANRKFVNGEEAVSAVIGVILMVAITVAIAATAYMYITGIIGGMNGAAPAIGFSVSESENTVKVLSADPGISWSDINITCINTTAKSYITETGEVTAGQIIDPDTDQTLTGDVTISFIHTPTNTMIWSHTFSNVT